MKQSNKIPCHFKSKDSKKLILGNYKPELIDIMKNQSNPYERYEDGELAKYFKNFIYAHRIPYLNKLNKNENYEVKFVWYPKFKRQGYTTGKNKKGLYKIFFNDGNNPKFIDNIQSTDIEFQDDNPKFYSERLNRINDKINKYTKLDI